jgi:hypothetical protein
MAFGIIQTLYIIAFAFLFEKAGFRWKWFLQLASAFIIATLLTALATGQGFSSAPADAEDRMKLAAVPMYLIFCPIHAFITVSVMNALPRDAPRFQKLFVKILIYQAAALAAGAVLMLVAMVVMLVYNLVKG